MDAASVSTYFFVYSGQRDCKLRGFIAARSLSSVFTMQMHHQFHFIHAESYNVMLFSLVQSGFIPTVPVKLEIQRVMIKSENKDAKKYSMAKIQKETAYRAAMERIEELLPLTDDNQS